MKHTFHLAVKDITLPGLLYGLGDPARLRIAQNLYNAGKPLICMEAVEGIENLPVSTRSHCFQVLRSSGLIRSEKKGRECFNSLRVEEIEKKFPGVLSSILSLKPGKRTKKTA